MDNKVFNVNGESKAHLKLALDTLLFSEYGNPRKADGWKIDKAKGLVLLWHTKGQEGQNKFPTPLNAEQLADMLFTWLHSEELDISGPVNKRTKIADMFPMEGWDADADHDGSNSLGWRLYCEDWGHVGGEHYAIAAFKPAYCWHGK